MQLHFAKRSSPPSNPTTSHPLLGSQPQTCAIKDMTGLVGAGSLDVAGLLALVADTLVGSLRRAVAGQVADLAAYNTVRAVAWHEWEWYLQL